VDLYSTLHAVGAVTFDNALNVNGALGVTGAATLKSTLSTIGAADFSADVTMQNNLTVRSDIHSLNTLTVDGVATYNSTSHMIGDVTMDNNLLVKGNLTVNGTTTTINSTDVSVADVAILLAKGNVADTLQTGLQLEYKTGGNVKYAGLKRLPSSAVNGGEFVFFKDSAKTIEQNDASGNPDVYAAVIADSFNSASDRNLKNNIVTLDGALDKLDAMRGVYHDWIDQSQSKDRQIGVIAQEVQAVYPELVNEGSNGYLSVNYPKLTAVLLQSVKELKAMVLELAKK
jgi:hypothetical protein